MLVAVEGVDGSGKGTQTRLLEERARAEGLSVRVFSFPRYGDNPFADAAAAFLNAEFGDAPPQLAALPYAGDRWLAKPLLEAALRECDLVVCDRYVASNMAHQGARLDGDDRAKLLAWLDDLEYGIYGLPRPALTVLLDIPAETAHELVRRKDARSYTTDAHDMLEGDTRHLAAAQDVYRSLVDDAWHVVDVVHDGELRAPDEIAEDVWNAVRSRR